MAVREVIHFPFRAQLSPSLEFLAPGSPQLVAKSPARLKAKFESKDKTRSEDLHPRPKLVTLRCKVLVTVRCGTGRLRILNAQLAFHVGMESHG